MTKKRPPMISRHRRTSLAALIASSLLWASSACNKDRADKSSPRADAPSSSNGQARRLAPSASTTSPQTRPRLSLEWDPNTGKGAVVHTRPTGDLFRTCFHCGYPKYSGGLVIGNYSGSGFGFYPKKPIRGHRRINVFCAQDESIWDLDEQKEYTYGWSENYGRGDDGEVLRYIKGRILLSEPDRIALESINHNGCYRVAKVAYTRADAAWWILATRITNACDHPIRFDFFTGDDPWLGRYHTSDGDVGWTPAGTIRRERMLGLGRFTVGGIWDLGNTRLGQQEGSFTNQANFIRLDPATPLPDKTFVANAFAHRETDIDPERPLDNRSLTALNMGWTDRRLAPRESLLVAFALGLADTSSEVALPSAPKIADEDWSVWRRYLEDTAATASGRIEFASELVVLDIESHEMTVTGTYTVRNPSNAAMVVGITYPIITAPDRPAPEALDFDGSPEAVVSRSDSLAEARFKLAIPARGIRTFRVRYTQRHKPGRAVYMVTSANRWPTPLTHARFVIRHPETFEDVRLSFPAEQVIRTDGTVEHRITRQPFSPDKEMEITWRATR